MHRKLVGTVLIAVLACAAGTAQASADFEAKLKRADAVRSAEPTKFRQLLAELRAQRKSATAEQTDRLRYLEAYETAMYSNRFGEAVEIAKDVFRTSRSEELQYRAGSFIVNVSALNRDFATGMRYLEKTLPLRNRIANKDIRHDGIGAVALLYSELGQYATAKGYTDEVLSDSPGDRAKCTNGTVKIQSMFRLGELEPARFKEAHEFIAVCRKIDEKVMANLLTSSLARQMATVGDARAAVSLMEGSINEVHNTGYPRLIAEFHAVLAEMKMNLGDVAAAEAEAKETVTLANAVNASEWLVMAYNTLFRVAESRGQIEEALAAYKRFAETEKAYLGDVKARELAYAIASQETKRQQQHIALLQRENVVMQLEQRLQRENAQKAYMAMVFLTLLLAASVYWAIRSKRHQQQLRELAQTDTLTGIGNRHFFTKSSERTIAECAREGDQVALVMFDLDHFKGINDTYGHGAGDWVLNQVGKACQSKCRKVDVIGRLGGEEFAILLRGMDAAGASRIAEDCRAHLAQLDTRETGNSFVVTASFGVSSSAGSGYDLSRLMTNADQMLYRAKNEGRNRVCVHAADAAADARQGVKRSGPALTVVNS
jgi:diguanylate cyclase (GGDEF)-like protein